MSPDARNSLEAWATVTLFAVALFFVVTALKFISIPQWMIGVSGFVGLIALGQLIYGLWQRRHREEIR